MKRHWTDAHSFSAFPLESRILCLWSVDTNLSQFRPQIIYLENLWRLLVLLQFAKVTQIPTSLELFNLPKGTVSIYLTMNFDFSGNSNFYYLSIHFNIFSVEERVSIWPFIQVKAVSWSMYTEWIMLIYNTVN